VVGGWYLAKRWRSWVAVSTTAAFRPPVSLRTYLPLAPYPLLSSPTYPTTSSHDLSLYVPLLPPPVRPFANGAYTDTGCITPSASLRSFSLPMDEGVAAWWCVSVSAAWWMNGILEGRKWCTVLPKALSQRSYVTHRTGDTGIRGSHPISAREDAPRARAAVAHVEVRTSCARRI